MYLLFASHRVSVAPASGQSPQIYRLLRVDRRLAPAQRRLAPAFPICYGVQMGASGAPSATASRPAGRPPAAVTVQVDTRINFSGYHRAGNREVNVRDKIRAFYYPDFWVQAPTLKKAILVFDEIHFMDRPSFMFGGGREGSVGMVGAASPIRPYEQSFRDNGVPLYVHEAPGGLRRVNFWKKWKLTCPT